MGASNCPETPRQRMIGMMYLVLTALLALNVSKDILNAFAIVDGTIHTSNKITVSKNNQDYAELQRQKDVLGEEKVAKEFAKAMQIQAISNDMVKYIEDLKISYIAHVENETALTAEGTIKTVADLKNKDNKSKSTDFMINEKKAIELRDRLDEFRSQMLSFVDEQDRAAMSQTIGLNVNDKYKNANGTPETWEAHYFENVIFAAGVTLLSKTIGEVRNAESGVLRYVIQSITKNDFNFSTVKAKVIATSQLVFQGEPYEADIIVAAYDDKQPIDAYWRSGIGVLASEQGAAYIKGNEGVAKLKIPTNAVGDFSYTGFIKMTSPDGTLVRHPFAEKYTVMSPAATVAADKMNVLYAGIENPVSVTASVPAEKVSISLTGGSSTKTGPGEYNITVPDNLIGKPVTVNILADIDGKQKPMGSKEFRVKRVPNPVAVIGNNIEGGKITKNELLVNPFIVANMGADFVYDLRWTVNSFQVTFIIKGIEDAPITCKNRQFSDAIKNKINS
jgi:gliding motility-associated protein GldM